MAKNKKVISIDPKKADELSKLQKGSSKKTLSFDVNQDGVVKTNSPRNVALILQNDPQLKGLLRFNEFTEEIDVNKDVTLDLSKWGIPPITLKKGQINDGIINDLALYMSVYPKYHVVFKPNLISQVIDSIARINSYNPIVDYFEKCYKNWDHKRRLDDFFPKYLGTEKTPANILSIRLWMMGVVAKGYNPLTKFDFVLDFVGAQGVGKTSFIRDITPLGYYTDQFNTFTDKDDKAELKNALIANDDEMTASDKATFEQVKKFITEQVFRYRPSYGRYIITFHKGFVMARTTNEVQHLKDKSGDRRFLSIQCSKERQKVHPVGNLKQDEIDQVWGEVVWLYKNAKDPFVLTPGQEKILADSRKHFLATSEIEDEVNDLLANRFKDRNFITNSEMKTALLAANGGDLREKDIKTMRYVMSHAGFEVGAVGWDHINQKTARGFQRN